MEPRVVPDGSDLATAIAVLTTGLAARNDNTDRAWSDLTAYRDALTARQAADQCGRPAPPHRGGHSAPCDTSARRRFTDSPPS